MKPEQAALTSNAGQPLAPMPVLQQAGGGREDQVGRGGADDDQVELGGSDAGGFHRRDGGVLRPRSQVVSPSAAMWRCADAGAARDPLVAGVDELGRGRRWSASFPAGSCRCRRYARKQPSSSPCRPPAAGRVGGCRREATVRNARGGTRPAALSICRKRPQAHRASQACPGAATDSVFGHRRGLHVDDLLAAVVAVGGHVVAEVGLARWSGRWTAASRSGRRANGAGHGGTG